MYEQDNLQHKVNRNKVIATKEMAEQAFNLVRNERVSIFGICEDGILSGVILRVEDQQEILCSLQIISDSEIYSYVLHCSYAYPSRAPHLTSVFVLLSFNSFYFILPLCWYCCSGLNINV